MLWIPIVYVWRCVLPFVAVDRVHSSVRPKDVRYFMREINHDISTCTVCLYPHQSSTAIPTRLNIAYTVSGKSAPPLQFLSITTLILSQFQNILHAKSAKYCWNCTLFSFECLFVFLWTAWFDRFAHNLPNLIDRWNMSTPAGWKPKNRPLVKTIPAELRCVQSCRQ